MVEISFYITEDQANKLFDAKDQAGLDDLSLNEYSKEIVLGAIRKASTEKRKSQDHGR